MEQGLAEQMVYGNGSKQNIKHYYSRKTQDKKRKKACKPAKSSVK